MPITEKSFADRLQRGRDVQTAIAVFVPAFAPADASLGATPFGNFLDDLDDLNTEVGTLVAQYTTGVAERTPMVEDIKDRAGRVLAYLKSNSAWKAFVPGIKLLVDKIRNNRLRAPKPPTPGEGAEPVKKRNKGEQSYGDIEENFEKMIAALGAVPGYAPPATDLSIASLTTLATTFATKNLTMSTLGNQIGMKQRARLEQYDGPSGLKEKIKAIKNAVRSQYGTDSAEYNQIKGIAP
jgi:hypothetical protein